MNNNNRVVHFVGIGGIGMSGLARHLLAQGYSISGSDIAESAITRELASLGATIIGYHQSENVPANCNIVVYSSAVPSDNVELVCARQRHITVILREQLLGQIFNSYRQRIAICGTHGKTTATSMLDFVLRRIGIKHASFIGGMPVDTHSNYSQGDNVVVAEACEYKESFAYLFPSMIVALNIEWDHPDYYKNIEQMYDSYRRFFGNMDRDGTIIACGDSISNSLLCGHNYVTFGIGGNNTFDAYDVTSDNGKYIFSVQHGQECVASVKLSVPGRHNVYNALAVIATCYSIGIDVCITAKILGDYRGAERRWSNVECKLCTVVEDYAHHPTEIKAVLSTAKEMCYNKIYIFFQPHTYSRTQALWRDFVSTLSNADVVGLLPIYSARETPIEGITSRILCHSINKYTDSKSYYFEGFEQAYRYIVDNVTARDLVLVVGAGDIYKLSQLLSD